jgi:hypothetical protein
MSSVSATSLATLLCCAGSALAQWPADPASNLVLGALAGEQTTPKVLATSDGGAYVLWYDSASGNYDVRLQRLDADGTPLWATNGLLVSDHSMTSFITEWDFAVDAADHAIVVTNDTRSGEDWDIQAYRISPEGDFVWGADGLTLSDNDGSDVGQQILVCSTGDVVVAWQYTPSDGNIARLMLERISPEGELQWEQALEITSTYSVSIPRMAATSDGGFLLSAVVSHGSTFTSPRHLYLHRFAADGTALWAPGGVPLNTAGGIGIQMRPDVLCDGNDGAVCWWYDSHLANQLHTFVQRVSPEGAVLWPEGGVQVGATNQQQMSPTLALDEGSQDVFVAWQSANSGQTQVGMGIQRLNAQGQVQWGSDGITLSELGGPQQFRLAVHALPGGSSVLAYQEYDAGSQVNSTIKALGLNPNGLPMWLEQPIALTTTVSPKGHMDATVTPDSRLLAVWADQRDDAADVYLQNLNPDGSFGAGGGTVATLDILSPQDGDTLAIRPIGFTVDVQGFEVSESGGDGMLRIFAQGPEGMISFTSATTTFDFQPDMPGPWLVSVMLVDYNMVPIDPWVMDSAVIHWIPPVLEILSPTGGQVLDELPIVVTFSLPGVELEPGGLNLGVILNGQPLDVHTSAAPIELLFADTGANTLELVLNDAEGFPVDPPVSASVGFDFTGTDLADSGRPDGLHLSAAWPNPFNPSTSIEVSLDATRPVGLAVFDLLGREVAVLHRGVLTAGLHTFAWDASGAPSGVYFARLETLDTGNPATVDVRKLVRLN